MKRKQKINKTPYYLLGSLATLIFLVLAFIVKTGHLTSGLAMDAPIQKFAYSLQGSSTLTTIASLIATVFGDAGGVVFTAIIALILFFVFKEKVGAIWFGLLVVVGIGVNTGIKDVIGRVRPDTHRIAAFAHESGQSFASGHSTFATLLFGALLFIFFRKMSQGAKISFSILAFILTLIVMFSRIYLGVHYPSDTLGGLLEGFAFIMFSYPSYLKWNAKKYSWKIMN